MQKSSFATMKSASTACLVLSVLGLLLNVSFSFALRIKKGTSQSPANVRNDDEHSPPSSVVVSAAGSSSPRRPFNLAAEVAFAAIDDACSGGEKAGRGKGSERKVVRERAERRAAASPLPRFPPTPVLTWIENNLDGTFEPIPVTPNGSWAVPKLLAGRRLPPAASPNATVWKEWGVEEPMVSLDIGASAQSMDSLDIGMPASKKAAGPKTVAAGPKTVARPAFNFAAPPVISPVTKPSGPPVSIQASHRRPMGFVPVAPRAAPGATAPSALSPAKQALRAAEQARAAAEQACLKKMKEKEPGNRRHTTLISFLRHTTREEKMKELLQQKAKENGAAAEKENGAAAAVPRTGKRAAADSRANSKPPKSSKSHRQ